MARLPAALRSKLLAFARLLVDQQRARTIIPANQAADGYWFGGGNLTCSPEGVFYLVGRYRDRGDSRTGLAAGERGCELAIFHSRDQGTTWEKCLSFSKSDLSRPGFPVLSIEGSALHWTPQGVELFVSSESDGIGYPTVLEPYLKPGCGVWTIQRIAAESIEQLQPATQKPLIISRDPKHLHVKDPRVYDLPDGGLLLMYCTHPFCWSSSNTAFTRRRPGVASFDPSEFDLFPRGTTWDVAMTRGTCLLDVPRVGSFAERAVTLLFYDGGESLRNLDEHATSVSRPRGYSCEELGGVAYFLNGNYSQIHRLSTAFPFAVSPYGTGCSRYVDVHRSPDAYYVTWQQSQLDRSQPLVMNVVTAQEAAGCLS